MFDDFRSQIHIFSSPNRCQHLFHVATRDNPRGLCELSAVRFSTLGAEGSAADLMVFPGYKAGSVQILNLATTEQKVSSAPVTINAHQNELCCLAINQQGTMMATASVKGNIF